MQNQLGFKFSFMKSI